MYIFLFFTEAVFKIREVIGSSCRGKVSRFAAPQPVTVRQRMAVPPPNTSQPPPLMSLPTQPARVS